MFAGVKIVVFDLDGTLYEDTHHFDYYAQKIGEKLPLSKQTAFQNDYKAVLLGKHPLKIGKVYDTKMDLILTVKDRRVLMAERWDGSKLSEARVHDLYQERIEVNLDDMLSIGDLWWVPLSIGRHYGLHQMQTYEAFLETRQYMMGPEFQMNPIRGLKETLEHLHRNRILIVMTNSPETDSEAILEKLGLTSLFHKKIFMAGKPVKSKQQFGEISREFGVHFHEMLSVGDNFVNDILPAKELGCKTMLIDSYQVVTHESADIVVGKLADGIPILRSL